MPVFTEMICEEVVWVACSGVSPLVCDSASILSQNGEGWNSGREPPSMLSETWIFVSLVSRLSDVERGILANLQSVVEECALDSIEDS